MIQDSDLEFIDYGNLPDQPGKEASAFTPTGLDDPLGLSFGSAGPGPLTPDDFSPMPANESVLRHFERRRSAEKGMAGDIGHTLHALHDSLKTDPFRLARGVKDTGLSPFVLDSDFAFGQEKLRSEEFREQMRFFADNAEKMPVTMSLMREFDNNADTLALMMDKRLFDLESRLPENQQSGWGHVAGAWEAGMLQREANSLLMNPLFRGVALTEEEEDRLSVINQTLQYQARQKEKLGLPARMARGSVESLGVPLAGGLASGANMGAAGMAIGAAAGAGAFLPGAVAGGFAGLAAGLTAGAVRDIFEQEAALTYNELRNMTDDYGNRIDDGTARALAAATGLANAGLEYFGFKQMAAVVPGLDKLVTGGAAKAAASWLANNPKVLARVGEGGLKAALGIAGEVGTELGQEIVNLAAEEIGRRNSVIDVAAPSAKEVRDRLFDVVKGTIEATVLPMGLAGGVRVYRGARRQDALQELSAARSRLFDTLVDAARNSRVLEELPENGEALISALAESGVVPETVYIRPEAAQRVFFQGALEEDAEGGGAVNPERSAELERLAAELGITPESLEESLTLGTDIAVPTEKAVRHLFRDEGLYNSLRGDMRFDPEQRTDAELEELLAMNEDAAKRQAYLDDILNGAAEEMDTAATRHDMRMEMTKSHRDQLVADGFTEAQADAHGLILAAGAERFARMRGVTPGEWLDENFAGFYGMTREEFEGLRTTPEDAERERMYEQLMSDMGV
ncbi:MAG: hypothetical protein LBR94_01220, partial [Desulfovibrio sp.]|nr:hypothetical protein [Desulfovibrio sp.]